MSDNDKPILVLGGTGHYGRHIVSSLLAKGQPVRVLSRNAAKARQVLGDKTEIAEGDITLRAAVVEALQGVKAVVISVSAFTPKLIRRLKLIEQDAVLMTLQAAQESGVSRVVYISVYDIKPDVARQAQFESSASIKYAVERALTESSLNWTVLGAPPSMDIFFAMTRKGVMSVPGGGPPLLPTISPSDLGEIAAQAALRADLSGQRFRLAGQAMSFPEAAERIARATGRPVKFRKIPLILPKLASVILRPLAPLSDTLFFVQQMLGFIRLLNSFPADIMAEIDKDHQLLLDTFDYTPTTLEMEIERRGGMKLSVSAPA